MGLRINLNAAALTAHRMLGATDTRLSKSIEQLSSGLRINSAADDPAGLVISEKLRAQTSGLERAVKNANDAVNMVKTAEAALNEVSRMLRNMRDLCIHAANTGATDPASIQADQAQINNAINAINKIGQETQFGNKKLLDGSAGILASISGTEVVSGDFSNPLYQFSDNDPVEINVTQAAEKATCTFADLGTAGQPVTESGTFYINGIAFKYENGVDTATTIMDKINAKSAESGVTAFMVADGQIQIDSLYYGESQKITATSSSTAILGATNLDDTGADCEATVTTSGADVSDTSWTAGDGLILRDSRGNQIVMTESSGTTVANHGEQFRIALGTMKFQVGAYANQTRELNIKKVHCEMLGNGVFAGESVNTINLTTSAGAQNAILIMDEAIRQISSLRADLGAAQKNIFESSIKSLSVAKENIASSESSIRDTDMGEAVVEMTRNQIMQQSGVAMLAQANQTPQTLLQLLS